MITEDFHVHSSFSDGADPPEAVAEAAAAQGMTRLGFSDHGWAPYDTDCCIPRDRQAAYRACIRDLAERWRGRLELYCGVEQDFYAGPDAPTGEYDYVIGSVHYLRLGGAYFSVDWKPEFLLDAAERFFGGDRLAVAEEYFRTVAQVPEVTGCHIIGHFDLIAKLNRRYRLFDSSHPRYIAAWKAAAERLLASGLPFEINTGPGATVRSPTPRRRSSATWRSGGQALFYPATATTSACFALTLRHRSGPPGTGAAISSPSGQPDATFLNISRREMSAFLGGPSAARGLYWGC